MNAITAIAELIPSIIEVITKIIEKHDTDQAIQKLLEILGDSHENRIKVTLAVCKAKAEKELSSP